MCVQEEKHKDEGGYTSEMADEPLNPVEKKFLHCFPFILSNGYMMDGTEAKFQKELWKRAWVMPKPWYGGLYSLGMSR